jgi:uncharacterized protein with von Willebrand factor type A (vWA) domain
MYTRELDKAKLKEAILTIPYLGGGTDIGEALRYGRLEMFSKQNGGRDNAKKLIVVITDGQSDNQTKTESEARLARLSGIHIISVGVGNAPNDKELGRIASKPKEQFVFKVDDFDSLDHFVLRTFLIYHSAKPPQCQFLLPSKEWSVLLLSIWLCLGMHLS